MGIFKKSKHDEEKEPRRLFKKKEASEVKEAIENSEAAEVPVSGDKDKKRFKKVKIIFVIAFAVIIIISAIIIIFGIRRNDGKKIAEKLSEKIGTTSEKAEKYAGIKLKESSKYDFINEIGDFSEVYESSDKVVVNGVHVPKWVIFCYSDDTGRLTEINYYDYTVLKKNINGIKSDKLIDISKIKEGMTINEVKNIIGFEPICINRDDDDKKIYKYKYYYKDKKTKDEKSYYITVMFNFDDKVMAVSEDENNIISNLLTVE